MARRLIEDVSLPPQAAADALHIATAACHGLCTPDELMGEQTT